MASWTDGAEYAPTERPDGFATPRTAPLDQAPVVAHPARNLPIDKPETFQANPALAPLSAHGIPTGPTRDPKQSFATVSTVMTTSAWGSTHSSTTTLDKPFDPHAPIATGDPDQALATLPPPTGAPVVEPQWAAPAPQAMPAGGPAQVNAMGQPLNGAGRALAMGRFVIDQLTIPLVICLALGAVIPQVAFVMLVLAAPLAARIPRIGQRLRLVVGVAAPIALLLAFVWNVHEDVLASLGTWSRLGALAALGYGIYLVWPRPHQPGPPGPHAQQHPGQQQP